MLKKTQNIEFSNSQMSEIETASGLVALLNSKKQQKKLIKIIQSNNEVVMRNNEFQKTLNITTLMLLLLASLTFASVGNTNLLGGGGSNPDNIMGLSVAKVYSTHKGTSVTFTNPYNTSNTMNVFAGTFNGDVDGNAAKFYCIDIQNTLAYYTTSNPHTYTDTDYTPSAITYILNNYYPYKSYPYSGSLGTEDKEAAAVQIAIWHFADGVNANTVNVSDIKTRALQIIADANANAGNTAPLSYLFFVPGFQNLPGTTPAVFTLNANDLNENPVNNLTITLSTTSGTLSATSVVTNSNGQSPSVTLTKGSSNTATITASATVVIPQGTRYVHSTQPNSKQKLVLATPTVANRSETCTITWYPQNGNCTTNGYITFTQGGWGSPNVSWPGKIRNMYFANVFPSGLTIGSTKTLTLTTAAAVKNFLPQGGTPGAFTQNYTNPTSTSAGVLAGQLVALTMNVYYSAGGYLGTNPVPLGTLYITSGPFTGMTVYQFLAIANQAIGGMSTGYSFSDINNTATAINENFNSNANQGFLSCEIQYASIGDKVWYDTNQDGIQNAGEVGISNVVVKLFDCNNNFIGQTLTNSNGNYLFSGLIPGNYYVQFVLPSGYVFSPKDQGGNDNLDSDADPLTGKTICTTLSPGENDMSWDAGMYVPPPVLGSIGDYVWNDVNVNGIQDGNESGIANVIVMLFDCSNVLLATTTTDANGYYLFNNLPAGNYYVQFVLPSGYSFSPKDQGSNDAVDSDADILTGKTACLTLAAGENNLTIDAGMYVTPPQVGSLGDYVWNDANMDGIQDNGEMGIANVTVKLYDCSGNLLATTVTDANGYYLFGNLSAGSYKVKFVLPSGYVFSPKDQGGNDAVDSDADPSTGFTGCYTLAAGENNLTVDAGMYNPTIPDADLSLTKTVSNPNPQNGDIISYTITVTNHGPGNATGVEVTDLLPAGAVYQSYTASQGSYDNTTGKWLVGSIPNGGSATLTISVMVDVTVINSTTFTLGPATGFNVFVLKDINQPSSDTEGKMAVGRDAYLGGYSVGDKLPNSNGTVDVLIVGRNLFYTSGAVYSGNVVYGNYTNLPQYAVSINDGTLRKDTVIDFAAAEIYLNNLSSQLSSYSVNGTVTFQWGSLDLNGTNPFLNVFHVSGSQMSLANNMAISVPNGSVVLVNIDGNYVSWSGGLTVMGTSINNVLYNFYQADSLKIQGIDVRGSILAPKANVNFVTGVQNGQMIAKCVYGQGQFNNSMFIGNIPADSTVINIAEITAVNENDPDSSPNNGNPNEDDYDSASFTVSTGNSGGSGGSGGGSGNGGWQYVNNQPFYHIVISLATDMNGDMLVGTIGGQIFRSNDNGQTWNQINVGMGVGFIWSLKVSGSTIYAATEQGLFVSNNNGLTWNATSLFGKDVRAFSIAPNGDLYAGTWGFGVYKSVNNGTSWTQVNNNLGSLAVHALVIDSYGSIYAGTFGAGVNKSVDGGANWSTLNVGFDHIWALGITSTNKIFAGTYGGGVFTTTDLGNTWQPNSDGLPSAFIYSISVDANDNVYVSTWTGGIYVLPNGSPRWSSMGMGGSGVSSLFINNSTSSVYAGTSNGYILKRGTHGTTTGNVENEALPTNFELMQNYPNPFNPSTTIQFTVANKEHVSLTIYNVLGEMVEVLINDVLEAGNYKINFNGNGLASGMYIYNIKAGSFTSTKKMMLVK